MKLSKRQKILAGMAAAALLFLVFWLPYMVRTTSTPEYCSSCHVMLPEYEDWFYSGAHRQISCIDCHLPNDNFVNHYVWKGLDGMKDVIFFYTGLVPEMIHSTRHARRTIQSNCLRCHEDMTSLMKRDDRNCWDCHRAQYHIINH